MIDKELQFDNMAYFRALEGTVLSRDINWKQVSEQTGVSASTLTRMGQGKMPDADGLTRLSKWANLDVREFTHDKRPARESEPLALVTTYFSKDPRLTPEAVSALDAVLKSTYERLATK